MQMRYVITDNRKYIKAAIIHVTRRRNLAAYLPVLDVSRPFVRLLLKSSQRRWESHVLGEVENNLWHEAEETGANIECC